MSTTVKTRSSAPRLALLASSIALVLAGCGSDMDELQAKVDEIKTAPGTGVEPLPVEEGGDLGRSEPVGRVEGGAPGLTPMGRKLSAIIGQIRDLDEAHSQPDTPA